jgi:hypothetical protein
MGTESAAETPEARKEGTRSMSSKWESLSVSSEEQSSAVQGPTAFGQW